MNNLLDPYCYDNCNGGRAPVRESQVVRPTKVVLLIDEGHGTTGGGTAGCGMVDGYFGPGYDDPGYVHIGGTNIAFCDGHAKWYKYNMYTLRSTRRLIIRISCASTRAYHNHKK